MPNPCLPAGRIFMPSCIFQYSQGH
jgi:hypothetical protein